MKILKENSILKILNEELSDSTKEEFASYLYDESDGEVDEIPSYEETNDYIVAMDKKEYKVVSAMVKEAIENVADHFYNDKIELSDNATLNDLRGDFNEADADEVQMVYGNLVEQAFKNFQEETGVEAWQDGRMGRHIIVDNNFYNAYHYNELCEAQSKWENWVIDELEKKYPETEAVNESAEEGKKYSLPEWFNSEELYNTFKNYVDGQLKDGALDDPDYVKTLSDDEYESLLVDTWMRDPEEIKMFEEHYEDEIEEFLKQNVSVNESFDWNKLIDNDMTIKELDDTAMWLYKNDREEWDKFTDNEIIELAKLCQITDENPGGRAYDDEVFDELEKRGIKVNFNPEDLKGISIRESAEPKVRVACNINWETDGDKEALKSLPKYVELPDDISEDEVADYLSDQYGWLINSVDVKNITKDTDMSKLDESDGETYEAYVNHWKKNGEAGQVRVVAKTFKGLVQKLRKLRNNPDFDWDGFDYVSNNISDVDFDEYVENDGPIPSLEELRDPDFEEGKLEESVEEKKIVNPDEKDFYDGKLWRVCLYSGAGVELSVFYAYANYEEQALNKVVAYCEDTAPGLLYTSKEIEKEINDSYKDELTSDMSYFDFATDNLGYVYVDATEEGAKDVYFVDGNNLVIEPVEDIKEEVTMSGTETVNNENGTPKKVKDYLDYELEDDDTATGGTSFAGEKVRDFIGDTDIKDDDNLDTLNKALVSCGIKPITEGYDSNYRGDDYWKLSDAYVNGEITDRELLAELEKMYDDYNAAREAFKEITDDKEIPSLENSDIKEITPEEANQYIMDWNNDVTSVEKGRYISKDGDKYIAIDNRTGNCWTEEFSNKGSAIDYLEDRREASENNLEESADKTTAEKMCDFIGGLFSNMSEDFESNSESLSGWCEDGDTFRNAGYSEEECKKLDKLMAEIDPLVDQIIDKMYEFAGEELTESANEKDIKMLCSQVDNTGDIIGALNDAKDDAKVSYMGEDKVGLVYDDDEDIAYIDKLDWIKDDLDIENKEDKFITDKLGTVKELKDALKLVPEFTFINPFGESRCGIAYDSKNNIVYIDEKDTLKYDLMEEE